MIKYKFEDLTNAELLVECINSAKDAYTERLSFNFLEPEFNDLALELIKRLREHGFLSKRSTRKPKVGDRAYCRKGSLGIIKKIKKDKNGRLLYTGCYWSPEHGEFSSIKWQSYRPILFNIEDVILTNLTMRYK